MTSPGHPSFKPRGREIEQGALRLKPKSLVRHSCLPAFKAWSRVHSPLQVIAQLHDERHILYCVLGEKVRN